LTKEITHRALLRRFDGFLYVGRRNAEYLRHYGAPEERMFFVPHFVDNAWFAAGARETVAERGSLRDSWGAGPETLVALFVGKLAEHKRPSDLLHALAAGPDKNAIAVFVGSGNLENDLRRQASDLGVGVVMAGFKNQSELPVVYSSGDVLVLPSRETWGLVVNEAMACGCPSIVSSEAGCLPDMIEEHETGFSYPFANTHGLMERLSLVVRKRNAGHDWGPALNRKLETFSPETAAAGTIEAVRKLTGAG
jgi:glycosyltransferase involved in cell wall biosynthesis